MVDKKVLSSIHARFRQLRNGEVTDNLAANGITYRLAWGLESYRLREIAQEFEPSVELAETLWAEDVRESKMIAPRLYPIDALTKEKAIELVKDVKYTEIADQLCMTLLSRVSFANDIIQDLCRLDVESNHIAIYSAIKLATRLEDKSVQVRTLVKNLLNSEAPIYLKTAALWYKQQNED